MSWCNCLPMYYTYMSFKGCVLWTFVHYGMVQKWLESSLENFMFVIEIKKYGYLEIIWIIFCGGTKAHSIVVP